ncbi:MAG: YbgC/FadM family acyl-CoA thioesterase [Herminiimonas sp.]|nr:YbgC/FadM family acyl-CoA thioesterase [Herminiimonas sp.]
MADAFTWPVRVYYEDTDTGGIVFYANYLKFFERARTEWLRSGGIDQSVLAATEGIMFVVMRTAVDYHVPAKLDNELKLSVTVEKRGRASVEFLQEAWRIDSTPGTDDDAQRMPPSHTLIATGRIKVACVDQRTLRPKALPEQVRQFIEGGAAFTAV